MCFGHVELEDIHVPALVGASRSHLPELLIDHAHCEKKAAGTAMNLIFVYGTANRGTVPRRSGDIVVEELDLSAACSILLDERGIGFRRSRPATMAAN